MQQRVELSRQSLADQVSDAVIDLIVDEGLGEGDALPSTAELSERFAVSRTVIREALASLAGRGILTRSQGRESVVATPGPADLSNLLRFRMQRDDVSLGDVLDARYGLEISAAQLAASKATPDDLDRLRERLVELESPDDDAAFFQADIDLHRAIALASHNQLIVLLLDSLSHFLMDFRVRVVSNRRARGESMGVVVEEHRLIVDAITSRDPAAASAAMHDHLDRSRGVLD